MSMLIKSWSFSSTLVTAFKNAPKDLELQSDTFEYDGCKFRIQCTPNGWSQLEFKEGECTLWLSIESLPDDIATIDMTARFVCDQVSYDQAIRFKSAGDEGPIGCDASMQKTVFDNQASWEFKCYVTIHEKAKIHVSSQENNKSSKRSRNAIDIADDKGNEEDEHEPPSKKQRIHQNHNQNVNDLLNKQKQEFLQFMENQQNTIKARISGMENKNKELEETNNAMIKFMEICTNDNTKLKQENNELKAKYVRLNMDVKVYKEEIKRLKMYKLGNINGLNDTELKEVEKTMNENLQKIKQRREELIQDKSLCIICKDNPKDIVIQGCNHFDICDECKNGLPTKKCPRCQKPFKKTLKLNHL